MKLITAAENENYPLFHFVSENNKWEMGIRPMMFGLRVSVGKVENNWYTIDYCAGADKSFILQLFSTVYQILSLLPEEMTPGQMERLFPTYEVRPIDKDPCWQNLLALLDKLNSENQEVKL